MDNIGFVGLGIMGKPMALNLLKGGYQLYVYDTTATVLDEFRTHGATVCASAKEVATFCDIVISMVPDTPHVEMVALGENGFIHSLREGMLYIDMSTIAAATSLKINEIFAARGVPTLDAPVSGGESGAINGSLSIMVGGSKAAFDSALPLFNILGNKVSHIGGNGAGQITKSCNQIATALATQGVIEALTLAKKAGIDPHKVRQAMLGGFAQSRVLEVAGSKMLEHDFTAGFKVHLYRKDLDLALQTAKAFAVPLMGTSLMASEMDALIAQNKGELDFSVLIQITEQLAGIN